MSDQANKWREQIKEFPVKGCGRLDMATYMQEEVTVGRVTSDRVRYVYMEDGSEVICLGMLCDHVAFRAADYEAHAATVAALEERVRALEAVLRECEWGGGNGPEACCPCCGEDHPLHDAECRLMAALAPTEEGGRDA